MSLIEAELGKSDLGVKHSSPLGIGFTYKCEISGQRSPVLSTLVDWQHL